MQQVKEIYGRENGWECSSHHTVTFNQGFDFIRRSPAK